MFFMTAVMVTCGILAGPDIASVDQSKYSALAQELEHAAKVNVGLSKEHARELVDRYGSVTINKLQTLLTVDPQDTLAGFACLVMSQSDDPNLRDAIIKFIQLDRPNELTDNQANSIGFAMTALGWKADDVSLNFLRSLVSKSYWTTRFPGLLIQKKWIKSVDQSINYFRGAAISAISMSNTEQGRNILKELLTSEAADLADTVRLELSGPTESPAGFGP